MIMKQFRFEPLAQASYLIGCPRAKEAVIIDPIDDLGAESYVLEAADLGLTITGVFETHVHADYISCARELAEMNDVPHYLHESATDLVKYTFTPFKDGQVFEIGGVRIKTLHTPGHTPEHTSFLVTDTARADEPWCVLTGDALFVGDVGRPDLLLGDQALDVMDEATRAETLYRSVKDKLFALPDHVEVYPCHYGGSTCGGVNMSGKAASTIAFEKRFNLAMQKETPEAFAAFVKETAKPFPDDYARIKSYNLGLISKDEITEAAV
jgi:glyoxylase-like metal-dependent hydrolase (beta-lactamase superfamily II)